MSKAPWSAETKAKHGIETAPGDVAPKVKRASPKKKITMDMVAGLVDLINLPLSFITPAYALSEVESAALTVAICDLAAQNAWVNNLISNLLTVNNSAQLPIVLGAIVTNKLIVAEKVPPMASIATEGILAAVASRRGKGFANVVSNARTESQAEGEGERPARASQTSSIQTGMAQTQPGPTEGDGEEIPPRSSGL